ncbi:MAG: hypothetical protein KGK08_12455 [Acidobacteriota bacterium]|nr:hypothetical protein [Acidobacteriota bacterium]
MRRVLVLGALLVAMVWGGVCAASHRRAGEPAVATGVAVDGAAQPVQLAAIEPEYHFAVLAGSTRQIAVRLTGGRTGKVNWRIAATTGGASATLTTPQVSHVDAVQGSIGTVEVDLGPGAGNCQITGAQKSIGSYAVQSPATVTVEAISVDEPAKTAHFLFNVCANTTRVIVGPAYQQAYQAQPVSLQSWVTGNTDESGTWSVVSQPNGGDGKLTDTDRRDAVFQATISGRYTLRYTSHADSKQSAAAIVFVAPQPLPAYAATPQRTMPHACFRDPALTGADLEVGAGKQYASLVALPPANTWRPGTVIRVWNTDTTGSSPTVYHELVQIATSGTPLQPIVLCGVPDAAGNLPILDGENAVAQAGASTAAAVNLGIVSLWPGGYGKGTPYGYWQSGSAGPNYVSVTGLHLRHATPAYRYTLAGSGQGGRYAGGAACLNVRSGSYLDFAGNDLEGCTNGIFTAENTNSAWAPVTQVVTITGNHIHGSGWAQDFTEHQVYFQSFFGVLQGNLLDEYLKTAQGSNIKWRGVEGIFRYNVLASGTARDFDLVENQDATPYVSLEAYLSQHGQTDCYASLYCSGDTAGANVIAAYQESAQKDFLYGNLIEGRSAQYQVHYAEDHDGGMADRNGVLYFYANTLAAAQVVFDTGSNGLGYNPYLQPRVEAQNNLLWARDQQTEFGRYATIIGRWTTNVMKAGTFRIDPPIAGGSFNAGDSHGWESGCDGDCPWPGVHPIDGHQYGLSAANFLQLTQRPFEVGTYAPVAEKPLAVGTPLSGARALLPVRWQYSRSSYSLVPRQNPLVVGATDGAAAR